LEQSEKRSGEKRLDFYRERLVREEEDNIILKRRTCSDQPFVCNPDQEWRLEELSWVAKCFLTWDWM